MESVGISCLNNGSISEDILTKLMKTVSSELTLKAHSMLGTIYNIIILMLCVLGIPGNLFVVAVYTRRMTTSTRAYMFALGIVDTIICLFYTVMHTASWPHRNTNSNIRIQSVGHVLYAFIGVPRYGALSCRGPTSQVHSDSGKGENGARCYWRCCHLLRHYIDCGPGVCSETRSSDPH